MFSFQLCVIGRMRSGRGSHQNESLVLPPGFQPISFPSRRQVGFPRTTVDTRLMFANGATTEQTPLFVNRAGVGDERRGFVFSSRDAPPVFVFRR